MKETKCNNSFLKSEFIDVVQCSNNSFTKILKADEFLLRYLIVWKFNSIEKFSSKLGLTRMAFYNKLIGLSNFTAIEIATISELLALSPKNMMSIFFHNTDFSWDYIEKDFNEFIREFETYLKIAQPKLNNIEYLYNIVGNELNLIPERINWFKEGCDKYPKISKTIIKR